MADRTKASQLAVTSGTVYIPETFRIRNLLPTKLHEGDHALLELGRWQHCS